MKQRHTIVCPQCGTSVKLPWLWVVGVETVFRCPSCRLPFKTGYKTGAALSALGLAIAFTIVQIVVFLFSPYLTIPAIIAAIPLWIAIASRMRRAVLIRRATKRASQRTQKN